MEEIRAHSALAKSLVSDKTHFRKAQGAMVGKEKEFTSETENDQVSFDNIQQG